MKRLIKTLIPLFITLFFMMLGNGFYTTFASLRLSQEGSSKLMIGVVTSAYFTGMSLGSLYIEGLIERIGHIRSFSLFAALNIVFVILQAHLPDALWWVVFRFIVGICFCAYYITIESWLLLVTTTQVRGKALSLYMLFLYAGQGTGQFILNTTKLDGSAPFLITATLAAAAIVPICLIKGKDPLHIESVPLRISYLIKKSPLGVLGSVIGGMILSSFYGLAPIFSREMGFTNFQISQIMGFTIIGGLILQWPIGHLSDLFDRPKVLIGCCGLLIINCLAIYFFDTAPFYVVLTLTIIFGGLSFTIYPLSISYTCDHFSPYLIVKITCALLIIYGFGSVLGPLCAPWAMYYIGPGGLFLFSAVLALILMLYGGYRVASGKTVSSFAQGEYIPLPRSSSLVTYLYPRNKGYNFETDEEDEED